MSHSKAMDYLWMEGKGAGLATGRVVLAGQVVVARPLHPILEGLNEAVGEGQRPYVLR